MLQLLCVVRVYQAIHGGCQRLQSEWKLSMFDVG